MQKAANLATTNFRYGIELGGVSGIDQFIQTRQISFSHNIFFPRAILLDKFIPENRKDNFRTIFSISAANTERRLLYNQTTLNGSWGLRIPEKECFVKHKDPEYRIFIPPGKTGSQGPDSR
ncbi:MAG: hypothetical protein WDO71_18490 [Bacteroidota bacterium]